MKPVKIIIADDHTLFINGLQMLLHDEEGIDVIDVANDGKELLRILHQNEPDVVLLDLNMPEMNGLEAARHIKQTYRSVRLIILSTYSEEHMVERAKSYGVNGYLLKNCSKAELLQTIDAVMNGYSSFPYASPGEGSYFNKEDSFLKQFHLTRRESELLQLLKEGLTNQQIANRLFLSIYTVETHRKNIMQKLDLKTPAALFKFIHDHSI